MINTVNKIIKLSFLSTSILVLLIDNIVNKLNKL
jgi:hypothetical protein